MLMDAYRIFLGVALTFTAPIWVPIVSAMNNGLIRYSGPQMSELFDLLSAALDGYEKAYSEK